MKHENFLKKSLLKIAIRKFQQREYEARCNPRYSLFD